MKTKWLIALWILVLGLTVIDLIAWKHQDRRIEALSDSLNYIYCLSFGQTFANSDCTIFISRYDPKETLILARLDSLEARVDEVETAKILIRNGMSPKADIPYDPEGDAIWESLRAGIFYADSIIKVLANGVIYQRRIIDSLMTAKGGAR